jgi:hypothetical protein
MELELELPRRVDSSGLDEKEPTLIADAASAARVPRWTRKTTCGTTWATCWRRTCSLSILRASSKAICFFCHWDLLLAVILHKDSLYCTESWL